MVVLGLIGAVVIIGVAAGESGADAGVAVAAMIVAAVLGIVVALVQLLFVFQMFRGRNWARIVLLVLMLLQIASAVANVGAVSVPGWIALAFVIAASCFMYAPSANQYFSGRKSGFGVPSEG